MSLTDRLRRERSPGWKLAMALLIGVLLTIPLFTVWALVYDRQSQSETARSSVAEGWGAAQTIAGPLLIVPYLASVTETVEEGGKQVSRTRTVWREMTLAPTTAKIDTKLTPKQLKRSIYEAVVYDARAQGEARFVLPTDLARLGIAPGSMALDRAELRFGVSDARGLVGNPRVTIGGQGLALQPGNGLPTTGGAGFYAPFDARTLLTAPIDATYVFDFRGNATLTLAPRAGDTVWKVTSSWPNPSFQGGFLPADRRVDAKGFVATYRIGNLALGQSLVSTSDAAPVERSGTPAALAAANARSSSYGGDGDSASGYAASIALVQPVDLYDQVNRATKYGFLFIGFTFLAFLMFDIIGGVRVSSVEYLLIGAGLVLFFVLLLAFAEVVGFTLAYLIASGAIIGLITAYSSAVLKSWRRATYVAGLLIALYAVLYILLSLEAYSLLIGSLMLFIGLATVMFVTRHLDWGGGRVEAAPAEAAE